MKPVTNAFLERFSNELLVWARDNQNALKISQFYLDKGISDNTFYRWIKNYPIMKEAHAHAMRLIGNRRETGAITKGYDRHMVEMMMPHYDSDWKLMVEWRNKMKAENDEKALTKIVVLEKYPSSDVIPEKETK